MTVDVQVKKNRIDLEHTDLIETRNALFLLETGLVPTAIAVFDFFMRNAPSDAGLAILAIALFLVIIDNERISFNQKLQSKRAELDSLLSEQARKKPDEPLPNTESLIDKTRAQSLLDALQA